MTSSLGGQWTLKIETILKKYANPILSPPPASKNEDICIYIHMYRRVVLNVFLFFSFNSFALGRWRPLFSKRWVENLFFFTVVGFITLIYIICSGVFW